MSRVKKQESKDYLLLLIFDGSGQAIVTATKDLIGAIVDVRRDKVSARITHDEIGTACMVGSETLGGLPVAPTIAT